MSRNKHTQNNQHKSAESLLGFSEQAEFAVIKHDLVRVIVLNAIYLAAVLAVYFTDQKSHYLEAFFAKLLHF